MDAAPPNPEKLRQQLSGLQIYFIVLSLVIGSGVFTNNGEVLKIAGPMGLLLAVLLFGVIAVFVGETISELVQLFPVPNAIWEYVDTFVDRDVAWAIGILYWFTYSSIFPFQILGAANLMHYWLPADPWPRIFCGIWPFLLLAINLVNVKWFGVIETISGAMKLAIVFIISVILYQVATNDTKGNFINDGFRNTIPYATTSGKAFCYGLPMVAFGYLGIESLAMAAFEAKSMPQVTIFSQLTHWTVLIVYFLCTIGIILTVQWNNPSLPLTYDPSVVVAARAEPTATVVPPNPRSRSAVVLGVSAYTGAGRLALPDVVNAFLVFSTLSAANASLYISSRTLYGLTYQNGTGAVTRFLQRHTGVVWPRTGAPAKALFWSLISWYWLPFLDIPRADGSKGVANLMYIISVSQSVSCLIVWAALCLAYIRFHNWTRKCERNLRDPENADFARFLPSSPDYQSKNVLSWLQPLPAYFGLIACFVMFVFVSTTMWDTGFDVTKLFAAYFAHIVFAIITFGRKLYYRRDRGARGWQHLETDHGGLVLLRKLRDLDNLSVRAANRRRNDAADGHQMEAVPAEPVMVYEPAAAAGGAVGGDPRAPSPKSPPLGGGPPPPQSGEGLVPRQLPYWLRSQAAQPVDGGGFGPGEAMGAYSFPDNGSAYPPPRGDDGLDQRGEAVWR